MSIGKPDYYTPKVVRDDVGNAYLPINQYEAMSIKILIDKLKEKDPTGTLQLNTGDWWYDLPVKIDKWLELI